MSAKNPQKKRKSASDKNHNILQNNNDNIEEKTTAFNMSSNMTEIVPKKIQRWQFFKLGSDE